jgi:hypothetical protein
LARKPSPAVLTSSPWYRGERASDDFMGGPEEFPPTAIAELGRASGRVDDVGDEDCGEDPIGLALLTFSSEDSSTSSMYSSTSPAKLR